MDNPFDSIYFNTQSKKYDVDINDFIQDSNISELSIDLHKNICHNINNSNMDLVELITDEDNNSDDNYEEFIFENNNDDNYEEFIFENNDEYNYTNQTTSNFSSIFQQIICVDDIASAQLDDNDNINYM